MRQVSRIRIAAFALVLSVGALGHVGAQPPDEWPVDGYFSSASNQFVGFFTYILNQNVYGANGQITDPFPTFLPGHLGLDAVDVLDNIEPGAGPTVAPVVPQRPPIVFSTESNGFVWHAGGLIYIEQDLPYCLMPDGRIVEIPNWTDFGTEIGTLDALSVVPRWALDSDIMNTATPAAADSSTNAAFAEAPAESVQSGAQTILSETLLIFSVESNRFAYFPGGQIYLRQQDAYAYDPSNGHIWRFFNGRQKGLRTLDAFDVELERHAPKCIVGCPAVADQNVSLGAPVISTKTNQFAHGYYLRQNRAYVVHEFDGQVFLDPGASSLDAVSTSGFSEIVWGDWL